MPQTKSSYMLRQDHFEQLAYQLAEDHVVTKSPISRPSRLKRLQLQKGCALPINTFGKFPEEVVFHLQPNGYWRISSSTTDLGPDRRGYAVWFLSSITETRGGCPGGLSPRLCHCKELIEISQAQLDMYGQAR